MEMNTKAVVFDFDGTLTISRANNIWRLLYLELGYDISDNSHYSKSLQSFKSKQYDYSHWVDINKNDFISAGLNKKIFNKVLKGISLISGLETTLKTLSEKGIKLFLLSGNIGYSIDYVLGNLTNYFTEISANEAIFDESGNLIDLIATKYDFEGKADFISKIREEFSLRPEEITFVGNGSNDVWAYKSGAKTICINPRGADEDDHKKWTNVLLDVKDLTEILEYID